MNYTRMIVLCSSIYSPVCLRVDHCKLLQMEQDNSDLNVSEVYNVNMGVGVGGQRLLSKFFSCSIED